MLHKPQTKHLPRRMGQPGPAWVLAPMVVLIVFPIGLALYTVHGIPGAALLLAVVGTPLFFVLAMGHAAGKRRQPLNPREYDIVDALIVRGILQSPGVIGLGREELVLVPVLGGRIAIPYREIHGYEETCWFNGSRLVGRTGFWLTLSGSERTGIALSNSRADALRVKLNPAVEPMRPSRTPK